ncbi:MAG TPA: BadF/BadG/BcrA/BcrD ATPase family protein [Lacipirellulaceae bacterium]|nr:BadF/BadG/BcrA/BcrD ATPase family protein [Lacipirellulaceae bacterium]
MASEIEAKNTARHSAEVDLIVAVDTGGTKTLACLADLNAPGDRRILARGRSSAGNPFSVGFAQATRAIGDAIAQARSTASIGGGRVERLILSIAGAANHQIAEQFVRWVRDTKLAKQVAIVSDVLPILAAGTPECCGIALIAGTGSIAFGRTCDGRTKRCGGWGYLLGDEGSGYSVGRSALWHALRDLESEAVWHPDSLTEAVVNELRVKSVSELTKAVYTSSDPRACIASLSRIVVELGEKGEKKAEEILDTAASELADLVARTAELIDGSMVPIPLAIGGGFLVSSQRVREKLFDWLHRFKVQCDIVLVTDPLLGCIRLAEAEFGGTLVNWHHA